ncbi:MAG: Na/Pi cotransporter family protein, partial [Alphaproteobacteria bacterium]
MVRTGVTRAFGAALRRYLANSTRNRFAGFGVGLGVTGLLQSSTATALIISSFASRALIPAAAAFAVMLGADVGTTLVAQVLSFDLSSLVPVLLIVGVISFMTAKVGRRRHLGRAAVGLGLMLLSLRLIVGASEPVRESAVLEAIITPLSNEPWLALVIAAAVAWLAHSSLAIVLLIMSLAATSVIPLILAFTLVLGANIGGAIAPVALTFGGDALARRVPVGNLIMRLTGGLIALPLIGVVAPLLASVESEPARQIANFHTMFNLSLAIVFLPLVDLVSRLSALLLPGTEKADDATRPRYLDPAALDMPSVALGSAARETLRMGDTVE